MAAEKVRLTARLYENAGRFRVLRYSAGQVIPAAEFARLAPMNPKVAGSPVAEAPEPVEEPAEPTLEELTKAELQVRLLEIGVTPPERAKKAELVALLEEAQESPDSGEE
jgi:hypothetical protein